MSGVMARALSIGPDLRLEPRTPADAAEFFGLIDANRRDLGEWLPWLDATRSVHETRRYAIFAQQQFESHEGFEYGLRREGALVGSIGIHHIDWPNRSAQFGYWIVPSARGRALIARACAALTTYAIERLSLHRLEIRCVVENARSRKVAERLGYEYEGIFREAYYLHGYFRDLAIYATTQGRWNEPDFRLEPAAT